LEHCAAGDWTSADLASAQNEIEVNVDNPVNILL